MAQIPVEERRGRNGGGWWKWLLALLVVGLLVWFIASIVDTGPEDDMAALDQEDQIGTLEDETYREDPMTAPGQQQDQLGQQGQRPDGPVTDLATLENGTSPQQMEGSDVRLTDVRVTQVINDRAVIVESAGTNGTQSPEIGSEATRSDDIQSGRMGESQMAHSALVLLDDGAQGTEDVTEGQRIRTLRGTVRMADAATMQERDIQSQEAMDDGYFIQVDRLEVAESS